MIINNPINLKQKEEELMKIDYCAKIKAGLFLPAFTLMLELSGKTLAMCLFPGMPIVVELNEAEFKDADFVCRRLT